MDTEQSGITADGSEYTIIWYFMPDGWADGVSSETAPGTMPYFIGGEAYKWFQQKERIELTPYRLLCGVLISWDEIGRYYGAEQLEPLHRFLEDLLEDLKLGFGIESLEWMFLDAAAQVRKEHGSIPALRMLTAGNNVMPDSSKIRSDLIVDTWRILESHDEVDRESAWQFMPKHIAGSTVIL